METVRRLHNNAKRELIQGVLSSGTYESVLDVGCGRGGDIQKWLRFQVRLDMCDPNTHLLAEARRRATGMNVQDAVRFFGGDIMKCPNVKYDVMCYNFSLQYIFRTPKLFFDTIKNIKMRLNPGGKLIGCIPDSERIIMLGSSVFRDEFDNTIALDERAGCGKFGEVIHVYLTDTPYYSRGSIPEPIAYKDLLITYLADIGITLETWEPLVPVNSPKISQLYSKFIFVNK